jgi:hypothetical protein
MTAGRYVLLANVDLGVASPDSLKLTVVLPTTTIGLFYVGQRIEISHTTKIMGKVAISAASATISLL